MIELYGEVFVPDEAPFRTILDGAPTPLSPDDAELYALHLAVEASGLYDKREVPKVLRGYASGLVVCFAHGLNVPAGIFAGQPLRLHRFQWRFISDVYDYRDEESRKRIARIAYLSVGRRAGKSFVSAVLCLAHLCGPMRLPNTVLASAALDREQAAIIYKVMRGMVLASPANKAIKACRLSMLDSKKIITNQRDSIEYNAMSADANSGLGRGLALLIGDEMGAWKSRALWDTLLTSMGSERHPLAIGISTQAPSDAHFFSESLDAAITGADKTVLAHLWTSDPNHPLADRAMWGTANPSAGSTRDLRELENSIIRALTVPSAGPGVRNLILNQRVSMDAPLLSRDSWLACADKQEPEDMEAWEAIFFDGRPVWGGLDLSQRNDLTAAVFVCQDDDGHWRVLVRAWKPGDLLMEHGQRDRVPFVAWRDMGWLTSTPGTTVALDFVASDLIGLCERMNLQALAFDRWRIDQLKSQLEKSDAFDLAERMVEWGQGFGSMTGAVEALEEAVLLEALRHPMSPLLNWCVSNAVVVQNPAGDRKVDKSRAHGRIDCVVALLMALGVATKAGAETDTDTMIF